MTADNAMMRIGDDLEDPSGLVTAEGGTLRSGRREESKVFVGLSLWR
jgi:hypothetical protein